MAHDHRVEFVAMENQQLAAVGRSVDRLFPDLDAAEIHAGELAEHPVMIAGNIDDVGAALGALHHPADRSEEHTSELQSLMRISYAVFCLKKKKKTRRIRCNDDEEISTYHSTTRHVI